MAQTSFSCINPYFTAVKDFVRPYANFVDFFIFSHFKGLNTKENDFSYSIGCKGNLFASFRHDFKSFLKKRAFSKKSLPNSLNSTISKDLKK